MIREAIVGVRTTVEFYDFMLDGSESTPVRTINLRTAPALDEVNPLGYIYGRVRALPDVSLETVTYEVDCLMRDLEPWIVEWKAAIREALIEAVTQ